MYWGERKFIETNTFCRRNNVDLMKYPRRNRHAHQLHKSRPLPSQTPPNYHHKLVCHAFLMTWLVKYHAFSETLKFYQKLTTYIYVPSNPLKAFHNILCHSWILHTSREKYFGNALKIIYKNVERASCRANTSKFNYLPPVYFRLHIHIHIFLCSGSFKNL